MIKVQKTVVLEQTPVLRLRGLARPRQRRAVIFLERGRSPSSRADERMKA